MIDRYPDMRFWVAQNKTVPVEILERLARDEDARVRSMVATKRKLDPTTLEALSSDPDDAVRAAVARHINTPRPVLERLATSDPWSEVRRTARRRL